jgi:hypothetical protein
MQITCLKFIICIEKDMFLYMYILCNKNECLTRNIVEDIFVMHMCLNICVKKI